MHQIVSESVCYGIYGSPCGKRITCSCGESWVNSFSNDTWGKIYSCPRREGIGRAMSQMAQAIKETYREPVVLCIDDPNNECWDF